MEQDIAFAQFGENVGSVGRKPQFTRHQPLEFQFRPLNLIKIEEARKVNRALRVEYLPVLKLKGLLEATGNLGTRVGVNLQPNGIAFAPTVQLGPHRLKQIPRFFFFQV